MPAPGAPDQGLGARPAVSIVVPVHNERENVDPLVAEIEAALDGRGAYEIVYVDDGSDDGTGDRLRATAAQRPALRVVHHARRFGQSAAILTGVRAARAAVIATLDGDGQNDPADIPRLLDVFERSGGDAAVLITGRRVRRHDRFLKRLASRIANSVRAAVLGDATPDTGCGLKVFARAAFLDFPGFDHMHRFLPALMVRHGGRVVSVPVNHRPRSRGRSKYGILDRLWIGIVDVLGVMWLQRRAIHPIIQEPEPSIPDTDDSP